jgi:hypothetical protein
VTAQSTWQYTWSHYCKYVADKGQWVKLGCNYRLSNGKLYYWDRFRNIWYDYTERTWWSQDTYRRWYHWTGYEWVRPEATPVSSSTSYYTARQFQTYWCNQGNLLSAMFGDTQLYNPYEHCG